MKQKFNILVYIKNHFRPMLEKHYNILVVDDSPAILMFIEEIFQSSYNNFTFHGATNGQEAISIAIEIKPDIIIMDQEMPTIKGIEVVRKLKSVEALKYIPIILLSDSENLEEAYAAGANDYVKKPFKEIELKARVRSALALADSFNEIQLQNQLIEEQNQEMLSDIRYARLIQNAVLPKPKLMQALLNEYFVLSLPRSIVSGDFYWVGTKKGKLLLAAADCTGHGVSGAFMQMIGTVFLNEINRRLDLPSANIFLDRLREKIIRVLNEGNEENESKEGMDMAFTVIDLETRIMEFAGANNPCYVFRKNELFEIKGNRMPVGLYELHNEPFDKVVFQLEKNDVLYLFSDGYADQFGGDRNKKFRYNRFKELLLKIYKLPMNKQKSILLKKHIEWKGKNKQVDDILIVGHKIQ